MATQSAFGRIPAKLSSAADSDIWSNGRRRFDAVLGCVIQGMWLELEWYISAVVQRLEDFLEFFVFKALHFTFFSQGRWL